MLTSDGERPSAFGYAVMIVSLLLLPVAFVLNLLPMLRRTGSERRRSIYIVNVILGVILFYFLWETWGELLSELILCAAGVLNCD